MPLTTLLKLTCAHWSGTKKGNQGGKVSRDPANQHGSQRKVHRIFWTYGILPVSQYHSDPAPHPRVSEGSEWDMASMLTPYEWPVCEALESLSCSQHEIRSKYISQTSDIPWLSTAPAIVVPDFAPRDSFTWRIGYHVQPVLKRLTPAGILVQMKVPLAKVESLAGLLYYYYVSWARRGGPTGGVVLCQVAINNHDD